MPPGGERVGGARSDGGDARSAERTDVEPSSSSAASRRATPLADVSTTQSYVVEPADRGPQRGAAVGRVDDLDGGHLDGVGAQLAADLTTSADAWSRARVTTTRRPNSGRSSNQRRSTPATSPITITDGGSSGWSAMVPSVARTVRCSGRVPHARTAAAACRGARPPAISRSAMRRIRADAHEDHDRAADLGDGVPVDRALVAEPGPRGRSRP